MSQYYVSIQGQSYGPADLEELRKWHLAGSFGESDFVWLDTTSEWVTAASLPELKDIFRVEKTPGIGVEDADELPKAERTESTEPEKKPQEDHCVNHEMVPASAICPKCLKPYCADCLIEIEGLAICNNCVGTEKGAATRSWKRTSLIVVAVLIFLGAMPAIYLVWGSEPAEQAAEPVKRELDLGERPPPFPSEDLKPAERLKIEADLKALVAARAAAASGTATAGETDSTAAATAGETEVVTITPEGDDWITALVKSGYLPEALKPPREGLLYRPADDAPAVELWTFGETGRCFMIAREDTIILIPKE